MDIEEDQLTVVMNNRVRSDQLLSLSSVEDSLGTHVGVTLTPAPELHSQASNMKTSAVLVQQESITKQQFKKLAEIISEYEADQE